MGYWLVKLRVRFHDGGASWCRDHVVLAESVTEALELATDEFAETLSWATKESWELWLEHIQKAPAERIA